MEAGINADQNFYRRQFPPTSEDGQLRRSYEAAQPANFDPKPPQLPPKVSLLTSNLQTSVANGYGTGESSPAPDDFYRGYRGLQPSQGYSETATDGIMTATPAIAGSRQPSSSSRSNGNGTTPKHPSTSVSRVALRPSYRSASAPIDERIPLSTAKSTPALKSSKPQQTSVKDLLKRFDQNNEHTSTASRKPATRMPMSENGIGGSTYMKSRSGIPSQPAGVSTRAGQMTRETSSTAGKTSGGSRTTQRNRFAPEDQHSNNTLSSVPRTIRTRQDISGNSQASQSMTNLSPAIPPKTSTQALGRKPLFGEVVPEESGVSDVGFGITESRARRTSDPSLDQPAWRHQKSQSDPDATPSSPTAWYRGATPFSEEPNSNNLPRTSRQHGRAQSDLTGGKVSPTHGNHSTKRNAHKSPPPDLKISAQSRLPIHSRRSSTHSEVASSSSQRSDSPSQSKIQKPDPRPWSPAGRSKTPTHRYTRSPGRLESSPGKTSTGNASLKAYISAPLPKTSPPLRSSRPRLPVSTATTASSRSKIADRSGSPQPYSRLKNNRSGNKDAKTAGRIGVPGPVDFAASRERIQRAYSKSIQESEAKELRAAVERRLKAMAEVADVGEKPDGTMATKNNTQNIQAETPLAIDNTQSPKLEVQTTFLSPKQAHTGLRRHADSSPPDSPTLGIPGSFPAPAMDSDDEEPQSALSNATGVTEFDNEPQTEPPRHNRSLSHDNDLENQTSADTLSRTLSVDSSLLMTNDNGSIQIILDTTSIDETKDLVEDNQDIGREDTYEHELTSEGHSYGDPVFVSTTSIPMIDMQIPSTLVETPRQPDGFDYEPKNTPTNDMAGREYVDDARHSTYNEEHMEKLPLPEFRPYVSSTPGLPMINTTLDFNSTSDFLTTPVTEIDYESSDGVDESITSLGGPGDTITTELSTQRASQQSAWTDYTVSTNAVSSWQLANDHTPSLPSFFGSNDPPQPPPKEEPTKPDVPPKPPNYSPLPSPRSIGTTPRMNNQGYTFRHDYSGSLENLGSETTRAPMHEVPSIPPVPAWPDHSPPPPPHAAFSEMITPQTSRSPPPANLYNRRPVSSVYRPTRDSESRRESVDDLASSRPSISTPISSGQISLNEEPAPSQQSFYEPPKLVIAAPESKELTEKESKRLHHRAHVIKELIDTESVYLKDMNVVEEIYKGTAEACPKLEVNDVKTIFRNTDQIVAFSTMFLDELKAASASVYSPRQKLRQSRTAPTSPADERLSTSATVVEESQYEKDRRTRVGEYFGRHIKDMQIVYTDFLKSSEQASTRLAALQADPAVKTWLTECNTEAKGLTAAWDLDALLIKPVQRITRYQLLLNQLLEATPDDHPDHQHLQSTFREIGGLLKSIDDLKKRIDTVNKIVGRKRKESDVRLGIARAFGVKTRDKSLASNRPADDEAYMKVHERFGDDYLRLQVVLRDVEFYTRQANTYVNDFLRYLSAIELVMRVSASPYPELESKWARFNMSMRDMGSVALEDHVSAVRKQVIEPFEQVIKAYGPPDLAMKKRKKRRLDYEKYLVLKAGNKKVDEKLAELVEQYEALNETLKFELPKLSNLTEQIGRMCLIRFVSIQVEWYGIWQQKVKTVLEESQMPKDVADIIDKFHRDYKYHQARIQELGIANGAFLQDSPKGRNSQSTATRDDNSSIKSRTIPPPLSNRPRVHSVSSDHMPSLPTPDFTRRLSEQFTLSPLVTTGPGLPSFSTRDFPPTNGYSRPASGSPAVLDFTMNSRPQSTRPNTSRSFDSGGLARKSVESGEPAKSPSSSAYYSASQNRDSCQTSSRPFSGLFHSAMPVSDGYEESQRSSRASSRERDRSNGYNVLYLAASLFEFNISTTKSEAGYPYLTYQAGEIFDVIGEKGELWLAKNQDDPTNRVGWIWSKHFARLADY